MDKFGPAPKGLNLSECATDIKVNMKEVIWAFSASYLRGSDCKYRESVDI